MIKYTKNIKKVKIQKIRRGVKYMKKEKEDKIQKEKEGW